MAFVGTHKDAKECHHCKRPRYRPCSHSDCLSGRVKECRLSSTAQKQELLNFVKMTLIEVGMEFKFDTDDKDTLMKKLRVDGGGGGLSYLVVIGLIANAIQQCLFDNTEIISYGEDPAFGHEIKLPEISGTDNG
jgi:hypothetical protein